MYSGGGSPRKFVFFIFSAALILVFSSYLFASGRGKVCFQKQCFDVDIARTGEEVMRGLQFRRQLKDDEGMLFLFSQSSVYHFWMKDTFIPLDIIWLDDSRRVLYVASHALPCLKSPCTTYGPDKASRYVLEINAGLCEKWNIRVGDEAVFHLP